MIRKKFSDSFCWGVSTASFQIEGAAREDGRGESIWDVFCRKPGAVFQGDNGDVATDHYHRYEEDVALMKELGLHIYSFTLAWPRIQPLGSGAFNSKGMDFYKRLLDCLDKHDIGASITLYHWDLPQPLQDKGGWAERDTAYRFVEYAEHCFRELEGRATLWKTLNEPFCSAALGYLYGIHAPGIQSREQCYRAIHHLLLGHGMAVRSYREMNSDPDIGIVLNCGTPRPATRREEDVEAADRSADFVTRMYLGPIIGKGYPERHIKAYPEIKMPIEADDMDIIASPIDFLGVNYYTEDVCAWDENHPEKIRSCPQYQPRTDMDWPIVADGLYRHLMWLSNYTEGKLPMYVTENGGAFPDELNADGTRCHDHDRISYLRGHLAAVAEAIANDVDVRGYFVWSFIDNFEWSFGYEKRFGIVYCDYASLKRIPKDSFYFYRDYIAGFEH